MPIEGWLKNMAYTTFNYDVEGQYNSYFMVLNDNYDNPDSSDLCNSYYIPCTKHVFTVFSLVEQVVRISA